MSLCRYVDNVFIDKFKPDKRGTVVQGLNRGIQLL